MLSLTVISSRLVVMLRAIDHCCNMRRTISKADGHASITQPSVVVSYTARSSAYCSCCYHSDFMLTVPVYCLHTCYTLLFFLLTAFNTDTLKDVREARYIVQLAEPFDGVGRSHMLTPLLARHLQTKWNTVAVTQVIDSHYAHDTLSLYTCVLSNCANVALHE
jgi:hypothetical protein